ncbi:MAG: PEGA domain-containing protein, partial [Myxococcota bacterium]
VRIVVDDKLVLDGNTPFAYKLEPGTHTVEIQADGYETYAVTQEFQKNIVYNMPTSLKPEPTKNPTILFATTPADAVVEIDGREYKDISPKRIAELGVGSHEAKVRKVGYATQTVKIDITKDSKLLLKQEAKLDVVEVKLALESSPEGATYSIYRNNRNKRLFKGQTPATVDLMGNETYKIVVEKSGFPTWEQKFGPTSKRTPKLVAKLGDKSAVASKDEERERTPREAPTRQAPPRKGAQKRVTGTALVTIASRPAARIFINGRDTGRYTPLKDYKLPAKKHKIELVNDKFGLRKTYYVTLKPGESKFIRNLPN